MTTAEIVKTEEPAGEVDEATRADEWVDLHDKIKGRQEGVASEAFLKKLADPKTTRAELRDWIYGFLVDAAKLGALSAGDVEDLEEEVDDIRGELERLGNLTRAIASTNFFAIVQRLVLLVQERVQDPEILQTAAVVSALFAPAVPQPPLAPGVPAAVAPGP